MELCTKAGLVQNLFRVGAVTCSERFTTGR